MKRFTFIAAAVLALALAFTSCSKDGLSTDTPGKVITSLSLDKDTITLDKEGTPQSLTLTGAYSRCSVFEAGRGFYSVDLEETSTEGTYKVTVTATENTTGKTRYGKTGIVCGSETVWFTIYQEG